MLTFVVSEFLGLYCFGGSAATLADVTGGDWGLVIAAVGTVYSVVKNDVTCPTAYGFEFESCCSTGKCKGSVDCRDTCYVFGAAMTNDKFV